MYTLTPQQRPTFTLQQERKATKPTLSRIVWNKFLRWVNDSKMSTITKTLFRWCILFTLILTCLTPSSIISFFSMALSSPKVVSVTAVVVLWCYGKTLTRTVKQKKRSGNQHTYYGIPVEEIATYLIEQKAFPVSAQSSLGITQPTWRKIAKELEAHNILVRGENNSRVLNTITREQLVTQLKDKFPLILCDGEWATKDGPWRMFLKDSERKDRLEQEQKQKLQRREERVRKQKREIEAVQSESELHPGFMRRQLAITL